jgi:two-component system, NarL family, sensor histidine kinase UhpB
MQPTPVFLRLLLIAPSGCDADVYQRLMAGYFDAFVHHASTTSELHSALDQELWSAALYVDGVSFSMTNALKMIHDHALDIPLILLSNDDDASTHLAALHSGARDVLPASQRDRLVPMLARELRESAQRAEHQAALEMLHISEERFRAMVTNLPGMLFHLRRDTNGEYRFLYVSEGCQKLIGCKQQELRTSAHYFFDAFIPAVRSKLYDALTQSALHGTQLNWEGATAARTKPKWLNLRSMPHILPGGGVEWQGMATNISHSKAIEDELRASRAQLAELSSHLEAVKEDERERIARDIHDELGSILVRVKIDTSQLANKLPDNLLALREKAHAIEELLSQAMATASRVYRELRPGILKEFGLVEALRCQAEDFSHRFGIECLMDCDDDVGDIEADTALALFRIAQEALTNVAKHARAGVVAMRLYREDGKITLEIRDNGCGISDSDMDKPKSFGLRGVRERIHGLHGQIRIEPGEHSGTCLMVELPALMISEVAVDAEPQRTLF